MEDNYKHPADEKKVHFRLNLLGSKKEKKLWTLIITFVSFLLSASLTLLSYEILAKANTIVAFGVLMLIIVINIIFDIIGTAATAADEAPFHAMASRKIYGARQALRLIRNADKVSNFCNDVVGDICGVISGTASAYIIIKVIGDNSAAEVSLAGLAITGLVASFTVGGKAIGKSIAIENSNYIVYKVAVILKFLTGRISFERMKKRKHNVERRKK